MIRPFQEKSYTKLRSRRFASAILLMTGITWGTASYAQEPPRASDEQVKERLTFMENALYSGQPRAKTWWYGWLSGYSAGAVVMGGLAAGHWNDTKLDPHTQLKVRDRGFAEDMLVGSGTFALGVAGLLIDPFVPAYSPNRLRSMPDGTPEERRLKLDKAEELLRECAKREKDGRGLLTHLLNLGANAAAGLVTVWAFDRPWSDGLLTFATGEAVSLLNIFSQPRRAIRDLNDYEVKYLAKQGAYINPQEKRNGRFQFAPYPGGFTLRVSF
jgi:hypothetical protein